jgi:predicted nucleic acid-binding protein
MRPCLGPNALSRGGGGEKYDLLQSDPYVSFIDEPAGLEPLWRDYTQQRLYSHKVWTDAYLAAFAQAANLELVTFDRGFAQYQNVRCAILS